MRRIVREFKSAWNEGGYPRFEAVMVLFATIGLIGAIVDTVVL